MAPMIVFLFIVMAFMIWALWSNSNYYKKRANAYHDMLIKSERKAVQLHREYFDSIMILQKSNGIKFTRLQNRILKALNKVHRNLKRQEITLNTYVKCCDVKMAERCLQKKSRGAMV